MLINYKPKALYYKRIKTSTLLNNTLKQMLFMYSNNIQIVQATNE